MKGPLKHYIRECGARNKLRECTAVYSVTNSQGFVPSTDYFSKEVYSKDLTNYKIVKRGMIAYNPSRVNVGSLAVQNAEEQVVVSPLYVVISVDETQLLPEYLCYFLHSDIGLKEIAAHTAGSVRDSLKFSALQNIEITIRSVEEQRFIIRILQKVEALINKRRQTLNKLDDLVKSQFIEMFGDPVLNPYNWPIVNIGEIAIDVRYGTSKPAVEGGQYPYLRMNNLTYEGFLDLSNMKYIDIPDDEIEKYIVRKGDILFNRTNSIDLVGKTCVFDLDEAMIIAGYIIRIRLNDKLLPVVFSNYMNLPVLKKRLRNMAKGAVNQANINAQELKSVRIYLPPIKLQNQFAAFIEQTDKSKFRIKQSLEKLEMLYKSLLQEYFG